MYLQLITFPSSALWPSFKKFTGNNVKKGNALFSLLIMCNGNLFRKVPKLKQDLHTNFTLFLYSSATIHSILCRFKKKMSFPQESVRRLKKQRNKCCRYIIAKGTKSRSKTYKPYRPFFRIQETAQLELGRQLN